MTARTVTISKRTVEALSVERDTVFRDRTLTGFCVRVYPSGGKVYIVQIRGPKGAKRVTVGRHGVISAGEARDRAALVIARIKAGEDPVPEALPAGPTVAEAAALYLEKHVAVRCKPKTAKTLQGVVERRIVPELGRLALAAVEPERVVELHYRMRETPAMANLVVETLSHIYNLAEEWGLAPADGSPCRRVTKYPSRRRERFLTAEEFDRLGGALSELEAEGRVSAYTVAALRLLMLTGCRRNEILTLKWEDVDLEAGEIRLRDSKVGPRRVPLSPPAASLLRGLARIDGNPWVVPGRKPGAHLRELTWCWRLVRARAGLKDVRIHDLRHSFASRALALGESLPMIARLLGHRRVETTARYAHLERASVRASAAKIAASIGGDILGRPQPCETEPA